MSSNTKKFAERELDTLVKSSADPENRPIIEEFIPEILALCEKFGKSGQSGGSAPYVASALSRTIEKLCLQKPICPITGINDEWFDVSAESDGTIMYQNNRCSAMFKNSDDGKAYYLDAIVWKNQRGHCWGGSAWLMNGRNVIVEKSGIYYSKFAKKEKIVGRQYVKSFPFEPKTFYVDIMEEEVEPGNWEFYVKDEEQLKEVWEYYEKFVWD